MEWLRDKASTAETPIEFTVQGVRYVVPRNYMIRMDNWAGGPQTLVEFRVTFPGFAPRRPDTQQCLDGPISITGQECARQDFFISNGYPRSEEKGFETSRSLFISQVPERDQYGFERYYTGPETARSITFRKREEGDHWLIFQCLHGAAFGQPSGATNYAGAVCTRHSRLSNGNELGYHFYEGQLSVVEQKDNGIRQLIRNFQVVKDHP